MACVTGGLLTTTSRCAGATTATPISPPLVQVLLPADAPPSNATAGDAASTAATSASPAP